MEENLGNLNIFVLAQLDDNILVTAQLGDDTLDHLKVL